MLHPPLAEQPPPEYQGTRARAAALAALSLGGTPAIAPPVRQKGMFPQVEQLELLQSDPLVSPDIAPPLLRSKGLKMLNDLLPAPGGQFQYDVEPLDGDNPALANFDVSVPMGFPPEVTDAFREFVREPITKVHRALPDWLRSEFAIDVRLASLPPGLHGAVRPGARDQTLNHVKFMSTHSLVHELMHSHTCTMRTNSHPCFVSSASCLTR